MRNVVKLMNYAVMISVTNMSQYNFFLSVLLFLFHYSFLLGLTIWLETRKLDFDKCYWLWFSMIYLMEIFMGAYPISSHLPHSQKTIQKICTGHVEFKDLLSTSMSPTSFTKYFLSKERCTGLVEFKLSSTSNSSFNTCQKNLQVYQVLIFLK